MVAQKFVAVIDDDESVRESLPDLLRAHGHAAKAFASADEFLGSGSIADAQCLILDVVMRGMSGPELQRELIVRGHEIPIIFITAHAGATVPADLIKQGAVACLFKPFSEDDLLEALAAALR